MREALRVRGMLILFVCLGTIVVGCGDENEEPNVETTTISPVKPEVVDDSEPDLSQTLEVGEDRSVNEGADLPGFEDEIRAAQQEVDQSEDLPPSPEGSREPGGDEPDGNDPN